MHISCTGCPAAPSACGDCVVTHLAPVAAPGPAVLGAHPDRPIDLLPVESVEPGSVPLDPRERAAVDAFARAGLVSRERAEHVRARRTTRRLVAAG